MRFCKDSDLFRCWITVFDQDDVMIVSGEHHNFYNSKLSEGSAGMQFCKESGVLRCWITAFDQRDVMIVSGKIRSSINDFEVMDLLG